MDRPAQSAIRLEVCAASLADAVFAADYGAARVELNSALELGGLTPSIGLIEQVAEALKPTGCRPIAMVRPRPGGFDYDANELDAMCRDIERMIAMGVDGVAFGVLTPEGGIALDANRRLIKPLLQAGLETVFHRAFDLTPKPIDALEMLIDVGFTRVLTSGAKQTALQGAGVIRDMIKRADGRIEVLPGGGIRPGNVAELIRATGCTQVHASLRHTLHDHSVPAESPVRFNSAPESESAYSATDARALAAMMQALGA